MRWWVIALAVGCSNPDSDDKDAQERYIYDEDLSSIRPQMSVAEVEAAIQEAFGLARNYPATPVLEAYNDAMDARSNNCPAYYDSGTESNWYDECTTWDGTIYSGYVYTGISPPTYDGQGNTTSESWWLYAGAVIETESGERLELTGSASHWWEDTEWGLAQGRHLSGNFHASGGAAAGTWLADEISPDLSVGTWYGSGIWGTKSISLNGVVFITAEKAALVAFDHLKAYGDVEWSVECSEEPAGIASVRGNEGYWYDVLFDGLGDEAPEEAVLAPEDCDGCGRLFFRGEYLGQACVDTTPLLDWEWVP
jgi:hypothetical protein